MAQVLPGPRGAASGAATGTTLGLKGALGTLLRRIGGCLLLALCVAIAISLLSWSVTDPSLTHAASGGVRNWMGPLGAILSDLFVQMLGIASIVAVIPPAYWAVQLISDGHVARPKLKLACLPAAIAGLSLASSSLPLVSNWPLKHGCGGMIGDLLFVRLSGLLSVINESRSGAAAGLFGLAVGLYSLQRSLGVTQDEVRDLFARTAAARNPADVRGGWRNMFAGKAAERGASVAPATGSVPMPQPYPVGPIGAFNPQPAYAPQAPQQLRPMQYPAAAPQPNWQTAPPAQPMQPYGQPMYGPQPHVRTAPAPAYAPHYQPIAAQPAPVQQQRPPAAVPAGADQRHQAWLKPMARPSAPAPSTPRITATDRIDEPAFDLHTDEQSRSIAERFAPTATVAHAMAEMRVTEADKPAEPVLPMPVQPAEAVNRQAVVAPGGFFDRLTGGMRRQDQAGQLYKRPSLNLLKRLQGSVRGHDAGGDALRERSQLLLETLSDFGIKGEITAVRPGPVVTLFEFEPARGTKSSRVIGLADDIARSMSARAVRIAVVPGVNAIGIELPNAMREPVSLRDLLETELFRKSDAKLPMALGKGIGGDPVIADLSRMPHLLVAGTTGSGKSVGVNAMILSLLYQLPPEDCRLILIDPKMLELSVYNGIPHLLTPVVTDPNKAVAALNWAVGEMESRYKRMSALSVRNIEVYNNRVRNAKKRDDMHGGLAGSLPASTDVEHAPMPHIVIVVDEFADLMAVAGKEIEFAVQRLAQMARAAGIHLIMATQRPSVDIITGTIKANFPTRISFRVTSRIDSRTILNEQGAEQLLGQGDMLYASGSGQVMRVHGPFVSDEEVEAIAAYLRTLGQPDYVAGVTDTPELEAATKAAEVLDEDHLYDRAVALVRADRKASTSYLQRRLGIGYNRAADLIERMERDGLVSAPNASGKRELLTPPAGNDAADDET